MGLELNTHYCVPMTLDNKKLNNTLNCITENMEWSGLKDKILAQVEYENVQENTQHQSSAQNSDLDKAP